MSLTQFWHILVAGRWTILVCLVASLAGAVALGRRIPKTYEAKARVILEVVRPDPVTGVNYSTRSIEPYVRTQMLLVNGQRVSGIVVDRLGWVENPAVIDAWQAATDGAEPIREWASKRISDNTGARPLEGGGTLEILYHAPDPVAAATIVKLVRDAYIQATLEMQTESAARRADRNDRLGAAARKRLAEAEAALVAVQRATGVITDAAGNDIEAGRLGTLQADEMKQRETIANRDFALARQAASAAISGRLRARMVKLDGQMARAAIELGTDNPVYADMVTTHTALQSEADREDRARRAEALMANQVLVKSAARIDADYREEVARIRNNGPAMQKLEQAQRVVKLRRDEAEKLAQAAAIFRLQAERAESGLVVQGDVVSTPGAVAPKMGVITGLAAAFGLGLGVIATMLLALSRREVLGRADLFFASGVPVLSVVPDTGERPGVSGPRAMLGRALARLRAGRLRVA